VEGSAKVGAEAGKVWDEVAAAYKKWTPSEKPYQILEGFAAPAHACSAWRGRLCVGGDGRIRRPVNDEMETMMLAQYWSIW